MASKPFVSGWSLMVIACCGNGPWWANIITGAFALLVIWSSHDKEEVDP